jgi:hypothetical protein
MHLPDVCHNIDCHRPDFPFGQLHLWGSFTEAEGHYNLVISCRSRFAAGCLVAVLGRARNTAQAQHPASQHLAAPFGYAAPENKLEQVSKQGNGSYYASTRGKCINKSSAASLIWTQVYECHGISTTEEIQNTAPVSRRWQNALPSAADPFPVGVQQPSQTMPPACVPSHAVSPASIIRH